ncbi:hypothetical protein DFH06DRAFT_1123585 [Mycena polygramma]|nr:hypothetical protein DFH06DRAFT_1123585 [Mycena polygramma]
MIQRWRSTWLPWVLAPFPPFPEAFEADFGYSYSAGDGWDPHFKRMAFHASVAQDLRRRFDNDAEKIATEISKPFVCTIHNPFPEGDPRREDLETERSHVDRGTRLDTMIIYNFVVLSAYAPIQLDFPTCNTLRCKYQVHSFVKGNLCWLLANPTHPIFNNHPHNLHPARYLLRKMFTMADPTTVARIGDALGPHLPQRQMQCPSDRLVDAIELVIQLADLEILCLPDLHIHPIQLGQRNVRCIFKYLPIRTPVQISLGGFDRCACGQAATVEKKSTICSQYNAGGDRVKLRRRRGHRRIEQVKSEIEDNERRIEQILREQEQASVRQGLNMTRNFRQCQLPYLVEQVKSDRFAPDAQSQGEAAKNAKRVRETSHPTHKVKEKQRRVRREFGSANALCPGESPKARRKVNVEDENQMDRIETREIHSPGKVENTWFDASRVKSLEGYMRSQPNLITLVSRSDSCRSRRQGAIPKAASARKTAPRARVAEMLRAWEAAVPKDRHDDPEMEIYLAAVAEAFEADFGYSYSAGDGWDPHFKRMAFHASVAQDLRRRFDNDAEKIATEISKPFVCTIHNPFPEGDPRREDLETERSHVDRGTRLDTMIIYNFVVLSAYAPIQLDFPTCNTLRCKYQVHSFVKGNLCWLLANPTHPIFNNHPHNLHPARYLLRKMFTMADPTTVARIGDALGPHLPQRQMQCPSDRLVDAIELVIQLADLEILCLPDLHIHPIQLGQRNVRCIFKYLPIRTPVQISLGGFDRCACGQAATVEKKSTICSQYNAGGDRVKLRRRRGHRRIEQVKSEIEDNERRIEQILREQEQASVRQGLNMTRNFRQCQLPYLVEQVKSDRFAPDAQSQGEAAKNAKRVRETSHPTHKVKEKQRRVRREFGSANALCPGESPKARRKVNVEDENQMDRIETREIHSPGKVENTWFDEPGGLHEKPAESDNTRTLRGFRRDGWSF